MQELDSKSLAACNGSDGKLCYISVNGKIYDVSESRLWKGGRHMEMHSAGQELGEAIKNAPHGEEVLGRFSQVGVRQPAAAADAGRPGSIVSLLLKRHPHPVTVHFPQALLSLAPLFLVLYYFTGNPYFERTCYYLGVSGLITAALAVLSGFFHWVFKYGRSTKNIYTFKISVSILLMLFSAAAVYVHSLKGILPLDPVDMPVLILYLVLVPLAAVTGHTGGKIVFG